MTVVQKSPTFDEPIHLYAGYSHLKWGDFRVNPEHPPLAKVLAALPLLVVEVNHGEITRARRDIVQRNDHYGWILADHFISANRPIQSFFFYPKLVMIALAVSLGAFVFLAARDLYGANGALAALALYSLDPNFLAHSSLIHTDIPFTLFFFAGTYFFWRTLKRVTCANLLATALLFALAAITKFSFLVILPIWTALGIIAALSAQSQHSQITSPVIVDRPGPKLTLLMVVLGTAVVVAYVGIWSAYGFRFDAVTDTPEQMRIGRVVSKDSWLSTLVVLNAKYFFLPEAWLYGLLDAIKAFERPSYLLGEISEHGFWLYFPIAFALKTPLPTLVMLLVALVLMVRRRRPKMADLVLLVPAVLFFVVAVWSKLNIGVRHILPIYPFLFVWLGGAVAATWASKNRASGWGVLVLGIWLLLSLIRIYPDQLAFFNELAGGSTNGHKFLVDSNLDWGQDLKGLKRWIDDHRVNQIKFAYFGTVNPSYYGINAIPAPGSLVLSRWSSNDNSNASPYIAISATYVAGLYLAHKDTYASFRNKSPIATIGHSILVYKLD